MSPAEYRRKRARIEAEATRRAPSWRKRALKRLTVEAGAVALVMGRKVVAHKLPGGRVVCVKQRFVSEEQALERLATIAHGPNDRVKPIRAFPCYSCLGWHLTSQAQINGRDVA